MKAFLTAMVALALVLSAAPVLADESNDTKNATKVEAEQDRKVKKKSAAKAKAKRKGKAKNQKTKAKKGKKGKAQKAKDARAKESTLDTEHKPTPKEMKGGLLEPVLYRREVKGDGTGGKQVDVDDKPNKGDMVGEPVRDGSGRPAGKGAEAGPRNGGPDPVDREKAGPQKKKGKREMKTNPKVKAKGKKGAKAKKDAKRKKGATHKDGAAK